MGLCRRQRLSSQAERANLLVTLLSIVKQDRTPGLESGCRLAHQGSIGEVSLISLHFKENFLSLPQFPGRMETEATQPQWLGFLCKRSVTELNEC